MAVRAGLPDVSMTTMGLASCPVLRSDVAVDANYPDTVVKQAQAPKFLPNRALKYSRLLPHTTSAGDVSFVDFKMKPFTSSLHYTSAHTSFSSESRARNATSFQASANASSVEATISAPLKFEFPHLAPAARAMMDELLRIVEQELGEDLLPTETDPDVQNFQTPQGTSHGSVVLRAGKNRDFVDRMLVSWLHCQLPFGTLDFATLIILMGPSTDAPHILFEFPILQGAKITVVIDLLPRKDLAADVEYLDRVYGNTPLAQLHKQCERDLRMKRYIPPSLYIRSATSPTALLYALDTREWPQEGEGEGQNASDRSRENIFDNAIEKVVHPLARQALMTWIDLVRGAKTIPEGVERLDLAVRDDILLRNGIEFDLISKLPRLFGEDVTKVVVKALRDAK